MNQNVDPGARLAELARCLDGCADFSQPMSLFFDLMALDLLGADEPLPSIDEALARQLALTIAQVAGDELAAVPVLTLWSRVAGSDFYHARIAVAGKFGAAFFFADRGLGCVCLTNGREAHYARLRVCHGPPQPRDASKN